MSTSDVDAEVRRKRALYRSWHRGTREMDLLLGGFADRHLATFSERQIGLYEALLERADADIYDWMCGRSAVPAEFDHDVMKLLKNFKIQA